MGNLTTPAYESSERISSAVKRFKHFNIRSAKELLKYIPLAVNSLLVNKKL